MAELPLTCPSCALAHDLDERFCRDCGMPLVYGPVTTTSPVTETHERARKVKPQYAEGDLVKVAGARNQTEGEFIQGLLLEEGVPSLLRRSAGSDVPDFLAAGWRDVMVPASGAQTAREVLLQAEIVPAQSREVVSAGRLAAGLLGALVLVALIAWIGAELVR